MDYCRDMSNPVIGSADVVQGSDVPAMQTVNFRVDQQHRKPLSSKTKTELSEPQMFALEVLRVDGLGWGNIIQRRHKRASTRRIANPLSRRLLCSWARDPTRREIRRTKKG